jgi:hypothetical protein
VAVADGSDLAAKILVPLPEEPKRYPAIVLNGLAFNRSSASKIPARASPKVIIRVTHVIRIISFAVGAGDTLLRPFNCSTIVNIPTTNILNAIMNDRLDKMCIIK